MNLIWLLPAKFNYSFHRSNYELYLIFPILLTLSMVTIGFLCFCYTIVNYCFFFFCCLPYYTCKMLLLLASYMYEIYFNCAEEDHTFLGLFYMSNKIILNLIIFTKDKLYNNIYIFL